MNVHRLVAHLILLCTRTQRSLVACEQALRGALAARREKEGKLTTTSLEFEYLHRKSRCEMPIGGDDISNDVITLTTCFSMFVHIRARFHLALIGENLKAQSTGSHRGIGGGIQIPERWHSYSRNVVASSPSFCPSAASSPPPTPRRACSQASSLGKREAFEA